MDTHNNASALANRHLSERDDGTALISFFCEHDPQRVASRLDFGRQFLYKAAEMIHGAFRAPAPEIEALAKRFELKRDHLQIAWFRRGSDISRTSKTIMDHVK